MKRWIVAAGCVLRLFTCNPVVAQQVPTSQVPEYRFQLSENKTGNIIFPYTIKSVDRGSGDVIAQVVQGFGNILQLKASVPQFKQTNVTVITSDGKFYSFLVDYDPDPKVLNLSFVPAAKESEVAPALPDDYNEAILDSDAIQAFHARAFLHKGVTNEQVRLRLASIYLKNGLMWFKLRLSNHSQVGFNPDNVSFSIIDKKQVKRTARQEIALTPVYARSVDRISGNHTGQWIQAFQSVTIPKTKRLKILISEKAGGRNLIMYIKAKKLLRARALK